VTGATGFVGAAVVRALLERGHEVRAMVRDQSRLERSLSVQPVLADLSDRDSLGRAARGCQGVVHCAADYRLALRPRDVAAMIRTNVGGTSNLLWASRVEGVERVVHCSTVGTLAFDRGGRVCTEEDRASSPARLAGPYKRSKWAAEQIALGWRDPEVVVVQPSTPVGGGDRRPTPTGQTIRDFLQGRIPAVVETGLNLVDVEAVGRGHVAALERGAAGRSYILGDRNLTLAQFLALVAGAAGVPPPRWRLPLAAAYMAAAASELGARWRREAPAISMTSVRMAAHPMWVDSARARAELGWDPGDLSRALDEAVRELGPGRPPKES
jgi:dihydroflavonol-4-reductase